ncbi:MAG TPA: hypothetical protein VMW47_06630 [Verrucomicrobiae bacterium]|nr:hypothetical protein [Verrucomicrobiae bacterium]
MPRTPPLPPSADLIRSTLSEPLLRRGVARLRWRTARAAGETEAYIEELILEDAAGERLPPTLISRGFTVLYALADAFDPAGAAVRLDLATGVFARERRSAVAAPPRSAHPEDQEAARGA